MTHLFTTIKNLSTTRSGRVYKGDTMPDPDSDPVQSGGARNKTSPTPTTTTTSGVTHTHPRTPTPPLQNLLQSPGLGQGIIPQVINQYYQLPTNQPVTHVFRDETAVPEFSGLDRDYTLPTFIRKLEQLYATRGITDETVKVAIGKDRISQKKSLVRSFLDTPEFDQVTTFVEFTDFLRRRLRSDTAIGSAGYLTKICAGMKKNIPDPPDCGPHAGMYLKAQFAAQEAHTLMGSIVLDRDWCAADGKMDSNKVELLLSWTIMLNMIRPEELSVVEKVPLVPTETCSLLAADIAEKLEKKQKFLATQVRTLQSSSKTGSHSPTQGTTQHQSHTQGTNQQHSQSQSPTRVNNATCYCCGYKGHRRDNCKLKDATCFNCNKAGHVKSNCGFIPGTPANVAYESKKKNNWQSQASSQTSVAPQSPQVSQTTPHIANTQPSNSSKSGQGVAQYFCARHGSGASHTTADCKAIKREQQKSGEGAPASSPETG